MLARLWDSDERQSLSREKEEHKTAGKIPKFPSLPESWKGKYVELTGHQPPEGGTAGLLEQEEEEEAKAVADEENGPTEGLDNGTLVPEDIVVPGVAGKLPVSNQPGDQNKQPSQQGLIPQDLGPPILEPQIQLPTQPEPFDPNAAPAITSSSKGGSGVGIIDPAEIEDSSDESKFLGLKFARSHSGNWMSREGEDNNDSVSSSVTGVAVPKDSSQDEAYDEFSAIQMAMSDLNPSPDVGGVNGAGKAQLASVEQEKKKMTVSSYEDLNEEEEFSLKSISTSASDAVGSILDAEARSGGRTGTSGGGEDFEFDRFDTPTIGMVGDDGGDNDSVQNAINSILDLPQDERMETPDLNNIAGLLDSMEREQQEQDPATEAAVNSIPRF